MPPPVTTRRATVQDVDRLLFDVQAGFDSYVEFAPPGWEPPRALDGRERTLELLADPSAWALLAIADGDIVGHVSFVQARERRPQGADARWSSLPVIPGLAHFWQLFVLPEWWGRGVAPVLHDSAIEEMSARGYEQARLLTPSAHARARRFYERRGWAGLDEEWHEGLRLTLCEYRIVLAAT